MPLLQRAGCQGVLDHLRTISCAFSGTEGPLQASCGTVLMHLGMHLASGAHTCSASSLATCHELTSNNAQFMHTATPSVGMQAFLDRLARLCVPAAQHGLHNRLLSSWRAAQL